METHYDTLQVPRGAPPEVIKASYRMLAQKYHPDRNPDPDALRLMKSINQAWDVLSDGERRAAHDRWIASQDVHVMPPQAPPHACAPHASAQHAYARQARPSSSQPPAYDTPVAGSAGWQRQHTLLLAFVIIVTLLLVAASLWLMNAASMRAAALPAARQLAAHQLATHQLKKDWLASGRPPLPGMNARSSRRFPPPMSA